jgi:pyrroline-5-carboxylate reductase
MKIAIIGYGNMGRTYVQSFISSGVVKAADIFVLAKSLPEQDDSIPLQNFFTSPQTVITDADITILAVKPQDFHLVALSLNGLFRENQLLLSVMAGVTIKTISGLTGVSRIIRSMPNVGAKIGMGMTVFSASSSISMENLIAIQNLLNTTGKSLYVAEEKMIDAATAVSGSGPAYVFYFMEAMMAAARKLGFSSSEAEILVSQTFMGAINLQNGSSLSGAEWISKVASKGGTTEKALSVFAQSGLDEIISKAIDGANQRATELGS